MKELCFRNDFIPDMNKRLLNLDCDSYAGYRVINTRIFWKDNNSIVYTIELFFKEDCVDLCFVDNFRKTLFKKYNENQQLAIDFLIV